MIESCKLINWMDVKYDDENRMTIINNRLIHFSPTEYKLLRLFLHNNIVPDISLGGALFDQISDDERDCLITKYINKIRSKLKMHGLDIYRIHRYGYTMLPNQET